MHIVIVTSVLRPKNDFTVFTTETRISQTLRTISSIREKFPPCYIAMVEGGSILEEERRLFSELVDSFDQYNVEDYRKSPGEATLLWSYLNSPKYLSFQDVQSVSKMTGRYILNENFNWNSLPLEKIIISQVSPSWMGRTMYKTRFYRIPPGAMKGFLQGLFRYTKSSEFALAHPDIEHCFYQFHIIDSDRVWSPEKLGVSGWITGTNQYIED